MTTSDRNSRFVKHVQRWLLKRGRHLVADGKAGVLTETAFDLEASSMVSIFPEDTDGALREYYGNPCDESNLTLITIPYPMRLAWELEVTVKRVRCHRLVAKSLLSCLDAILGHFGTLEAVRKARADLFGGIVNCRRQRRGSRMSHHAWGIAIDLDPVQNGLDTPWPETATMPDEILDIFESRGWSSYARTRGLDAMHLVAAKVKQR